MVPLDLPAAPLVPLEAPHNRRPLRIVVVPKVDGAVESAQKVVAGEPKAHNVDRLAAVEVGEQLERPRREARNHAVPNLRHVDDCLRDVRRLTDVVKERRGPLAPRGGGGGEVLNHTIDDPILSGPHPNRFEVVAGAAAGDGDGVGRIVDA